MDDRNAVLKAQTDIVIAGLHRLIAILPEREFTRPEALQHARLVRKLAVISSARHGEMSDALTDDERAWVAALSRPHVDGSDGSK